MKKLRFLTSGESHGQALTCIIDGIPSNLSLSAEDIDKDLARRQKGYGRGGRMKIESDTAEILSGVRHGMTLGSPISLMIKNRDWENWQDIMSPEPINSKSQVSNFKLRTITRPRPGHADLTGALKYNHRDIRNVLERSSARETAARVAVGAVAKKFLSELGISVISYVTEIGGAGINGTEHRIQNTDIKHFISMFGNAEASQVRCPDKRAEEKIIRKIKGAIKKGDSLGGMFEVVVFGVPAGLGSYSQWDRRLEARLSYAVMGIQAVKGVEIGLGFEMARRRGSEVMDEIFYRTQSKEYRAKSTELRVKSEGQEKRIRAGGTAWEYDLAGGFYRKTNNAGGIEGGMSNGMPVVIRVAMKPIPTLKTPLSSVDIDKKKKFRAAYERSDICAVPAASVIGEAVCAIVIADAFLDKFGGDSMEEVRRNYDGYLKQVRQF